MAVGIAEDMIGGDVLLGEGGNQRSAKVVVAHAAYHLGGNTESGEGDGLVGTFTAGCGVEAIAEDGFARCGQTRDAADEIHVEAAEDDRAHRLILGLEELGIPIITEIDQDLKPIAGEVIAHSLDRDTIV